MHEFTTSTSSSFLLMFMSDRIHPKKIELLINEINNIELQFSKISLHPLETIKIKTNISFVKKYIYNINNNKTLTLHKLEEIESIINSTAYNIPLLIGIKISINNSLNKIRDILNLQRCIISSSNIIN